MQIWFIHQSIDITGWNQDSIFQD